MKIKSAEFTISAVKPEQYPEGNQPEIALAGRSNVGKSSLINRMLNRRNLARTSSKPGKTQTLNYYHINQQFYFVDLPGYGFARVPQAIKAQWSKMIEHYLSKRENLKLVLQLVDIRHAPSKEDVAMYEWLNHYGLPKVVIATKADKISRGQWQKHMKIIRNALQMDPSVPFIPFSAETGQGKEELWNVITSFIDTTEEPVEQKEAESS
ncbi:putative GTP-binding protein EngB [Collibacillus ludicampi]|uniref:Probable GTP-binding protein EngB n=1 Tax=Collibacillus ludicampi TaxID=2771369 RepID=A0AAV4LA44_9BACL|nr:ribosome biogenesis GTP-binding protein YihA/YsxC [Collibacillus ludicampi]GIM44642.1 putative GTP-binding protein EngB [Collibacillus ludicampi]